MRKDWIRSRASGGICGTLQRRLAGGDQSSLRRRAIVVSRARSAERSSIGGRVSARAAAAESSGIGEHPQPGDRVADLGPLEQRGRPGEMERDAPLFHRRRHRPALAPGPRPGRRSLPARSPGEQVLGLASHGLRLRPLVGAAPEAHRRIAELTRQLNRGHGRARRGCPGGRGSPLACTAGRTPPALLSPDVQRVEMVRVVPGQRRKDRPLSWGGVLQLVDHQVLEAVGDRGADVGTLVEELVQGQEDVAAVEAAGAGEDAVVGGDQLRQLGVGRVRAGLHLVDLLQQAGQQAGRVAADLVAAQRQLVEPVEQQRQPLGRAEDVEEGVEARRGRVLAQQPLAELFPGADPELLEGRSSSASTRSRSRWAVARVEARTRMRSGAMPSSARRAKRRARTSVLPVPASPISSSGPSRWRIARSWGSARASMVQRYRDGRRAAVHRMASMDVFSADWLGICRRIVAAQRELFEQTPGTRGPHRVRGGRRGRRPQPRHRPSLRGRGLRRAGELAAAGASFVAISEERGEVAFGDGGPARVVIDPIDGSLNARRTLPSHSLSIAVGLGPLDGRRRVRLRLRLRRRRGVRRPPRGGGDAGRRPIEVAADAEKLELLGVESAEPERLRPVAEALDGRVYRLRVIGSIAITAAYVAAGRLDGMLSLRPCRSVDAAAAQLIVREAGGAVAFGDLALERGGPRPRRPLPDRGRGGEQGLATIRSASRPSSPPVTGSERRFRTGVRKNVCSLHSRTPPDSTTTPEGMNS